MKDSKFLRLFLLQQWHIHEKNVPLWNSSVKFLKYLLFSWFYSTSTVNFCVVHYPQISYDLLPNPYLLAITIFPFRSVLYNLLLEQKSKVTLRINPGKEFQNYSCELAGRVGTM
jgi:hypothetical protein